MGRSLYKGCYRNDDLIYPSTSITPKNEYFSQELYMIPSTKYQYELDGEKVLSAEDDVQEPTNVVNINNMDTPPLTIASYSSASSTANSAIYQQQQRPVGITLHDNPVPPSIYDSPSPSPPSSPPRRDRSLVGKKKSSLSQKSRKDKSSNKFLRGYIYTRFIQSLFYTTTKKKSTNTKETTKLQEKKAA